MTDRGMPLAAAALAALLGCAGLRAGAADTNVRSDDGHFVLSYDSGLDPIVINRMHDWVLHLEDDAGEPVEGAAIRVDGGMPAHDHGLPTEPRVTREIGGGDYLLQGMRFHMNGEWQIDIAIDASGVSDTVTILLHL